MDRTRHPHHHWLTSNSTSKAEDIVEEEEEDEDENTEEKMNSSNIGVIEREHMFDKVVTPSDVGKLNRLVIPKQHAEKYFPLDNNSDQHQKGLLLNFEDSTGKPWRFRYSYWNSSQSYVMTKGWSRFVKDKKLDAGDIVSFQRGVGHQCDKFFIDWRRRPDIGMGIGPPPVSPLLLPYFNYRGGSNSGFVLRSIPYPNIPAVWNRNQNQDQFNNYPTSTQFSPVGFQSGPVYCNPYLQNHGTRPMIFLRPPSVPLAVGTEVIESVPVVQGKRLRLFGVNMDCPINSSNQGGYDFDDSSSSASASSSSNIAHTNNEYNHNINNNNNNSSSLDPLHESLQLRLRSDHFQLHKGKSSSPSSMCLDFDF